MKPRTSISEWIYIVMIGLACALPGTAAAGGDVKVPERSEIEPKYRWATENIFKTTDEWERELGAVEKKVEALTSFKGTLNQGPEQLLKFLKARDDTEIMWCFS